jgi:release factor glutamine methyltransferase
MTAAGQDTWTTRRLLEWMQSHFLAKGVHAPEVTAQLLVAHVLDVEPIMLFTDPDRQASDAERDRLRVLVGRAADQEPVQYLIGSGQFLGRPFEVNPSVLIPRTATESILQAVLDRQRGGVAGGDVPALDVAADIGTGSGSLAISMALHLPSTRVVATDLSADALEVAQRNGERHGVTDRIEFMQGDAVEPLRTCRPERGFDLIVSNPPYISDATWDTLDASVREHEPALALRGGVDGLDCIRRIIQDVQDVLADDGLFVLEYGDDQAEAVLALAGQIGPARIECDVDGDERIVVVDRAGG